jgi:hypothetical protein
MTISMYKASAPVFVQFLTSLSAVLEDGPVEQLAGLAFPNKSRPG